MTACAFAGCPLSSPCPRHEMSAEAVAALLARVERAERALADLGELADRYVNWTAPRIIPTEAVPTQECALARLRHALEALLHVQALGASTEYSPPVEVATFTCDNCERSGARPLDIGDVSTRFLCDACGAGASDTAEPARNCLDFMPHPEHGDCTGVQDAPEEQRNLVERSGARPLDIGDVSTRFLCDACGAGASDTAEPACECGHPKAEHSWVVGCRHNPSTCACRVYIAAAPLPGSDTAKEEQT